MLAPLLLGLAACNNAPEIVLPTLAPTAEATPTLAAMAPPTELPPTPTMQPTPTPCGLPVQPELAPAWRPDELGCPTTPGTTAVSTAYAPFAGGQMLWRGDADLIYVLYHDGRWESYPNEWREGDATYSCGDVDPATTPVRGFGRVWCDNPAVRQQLGPVTAAEIGDSGSVVQEFVNGTILIAPFGDPFVLVGEDGVWRRVEEE